MNYIAIEFPPSPLPPASQRQPQAYAERRHAIAKEFTVGGGTGVRPQQQAPAPAALAAGHGIAQLEPRDGAPADVPAAVLKRLRVQGGHHATRRQRAETHQHAALAVLDSPWSTPGFKSAGECVKTYSPP